MWLPGGSLGHDWLPLLRGSLIERYKIRWDQDYWIKYGPWLAAPRERSIFEEGQKIYIRQTADCIIATLVRDLFVARNNLHVLWHKDANADVLGFLGILNSSLTGFVYSYMNPEQGEALAEVKKEHVEIFSFQRQVRENLKFLYLWHSFFGINRMKVFLPVAQSSFMT